MKHYEWFCDTYIKLKINSPKFSEPPNFSDKKHKDYYKKYWYFAGARLNRPALFNWK